MNMQDVLFILENEEKRKDFILRLKKVGEISEEFQAIKNVMCSLRVHKPPREVNQTTILRHTFQYCDGMKAIENFRLVSKSWKLAVETTKFCAPHVHEILPQIAETFGAGEYPMVYHKLLKNLKPPSGWIPSFFFADSVLANNFNSIAKLVSQNMKGLRSICITNDFDVITEEIYETFLNEFLPNSCNTLCDLEIPKLFLPNVYFPNLTELTVENLDLPSNVFKTQFKQILKNMPDLQIITIEEPTMTPHIRDYLISNYAEECYVSNGKIRPFPVKYICDTNFGALVSDCQFKSCVEYIDIEICRTKPDEANWNNFKNNIYDFGKLKGIHFSDCENLWDTLKKSDFYKPEKNACSELDIFYNIWPKRIQFLKSYGIEILNEKVFNFNKAGQSKNLKWSFQFGKYCFCF